MEDFKIILSERGKELILLNSFKYSFVRQRRDGLLKWKCSNRNCSASILTTNDKKQLDQGAIGEHNHEGHDQQKIERQILRENCKRKAEEITTMRPSKIIRTELLNSNVSNIMCGDIVSVRKAMYDRRKKQYPVLTASSEEAISHLGNFKIYDTALVKKWRNIKDTYIKTLKKPKSGSGSNKGRQYLYAKQLSFLQQSSIVTETESSLNSEHPVSDEDNDELRTVSDIDCEQSNPPYNSHFNNTSKRKRDFESSLLASTNSPISSSTTTTVQSHPDQLFFESIAPILNGFTEEEVLDFRIEVLSIIKRIKEARKNTRQIETPSNYNCVGPSFQPGTHMTYPHPHPSLQPSISFIPNSTNKPIPFCTENMVQNLSTSIHVKTESPVHSPSPSSQNISQHIESYKLLQHSVSPPLIAASSINEAEGDTNDDECLN